MKKLIPLILIMFTVFASCRKEEPEPVITETIPEIARDSLYYIMKQWYYWYNLMPSVTKENYSNPYALLEALRYREIDKWSFVADYDEFIAEMEGTFVGHGFRIGLDKNLNARIAMIYNNSPLYLEGVRRGWIVKKINEYDIASILLSNDIDAYNNAIGPATAGITNDFIFKKPDGSEVKIASTKQAFTINTVLLYDTLHLSSGITGHLVFESFLLPSQAELETAFSFFRANNVSDLILDLRYNSGGYLNIAQQLASYIAGDSKEDTVFVKLSYNDKSQSANSTFPFLKTLYPLSLSRLVVITTRLTASASEAVMNGLNPHLNLVCIGDTTLGKPMGMNGWPCKKKYYFWPVTFKIVNSVNEGEYYDGIVPSHIATDDITHDFADRNEECLKEAISWLQTGSFISKGAADFRRSPQFSEKPSWMNNVFVIKK
jgi:carboxyl-terminal processing protease